MSNTSWSVSLRQTLENRRKINRLPRVAVVGIGNELRGDDGAGVALARALQPLAGRYDRLTVVEAGAAPENITGLLRYFGADLVLLVDVAQMGEEPGAVRWLSWQDTVGIGVSTHTLPLHVFAFYLTVELGCEVALLGIQPSGLSTGAPLSSIVWESVQKTAQVLADILRGQMVSLCV